MRPGDHPHGPSIPAALSAPAFLAVAAAMTEALLERTLPPSEHPPQRLHAAMRHSVFAGGKRLRPALVLGACRACGGPDALCASAMTAVELLHTYTLIHDDLPAMDDDDLRRGRPTCHKAFDEATAILAGDALQALAFACAAQLHARAVLTLAEAAGSRGVVGGQQEDLEAEGQPQGTGADVRRRLERIHRGKTAALIAASCELGALAAGASEPEIVAVRTYGTEVGLAFQIADDILDATASAGTLGKTPGKDAAQGKLTYVAVHGLDGAKAACVAHDDQAIRALAPLGPAGEQLTVLAHFIVARDH